MLGSGHDPHPMKTAKEKPDCSLSPDEAMALSGESTGVEQPDRQAEPGRVTRQRSIERPEHGVESLS